MPDPAAAPQTIRPITTLRHRPLALWIASRFASGAAATLLRTVWAWQLFRITGSELALGVLGVIQFIPALMTSLVGGAVADAYDRKKIVVIAQLMPLASAIGLGLLTREGLTRETTLYATVALCAFATAFEAPARAATLPNLVPRPEFSAAVTIYTTFQSLAFVTGPATGTSVTREIEVRYSAAATTYVVGIPADPRRRPPTAGPVTNASDWNVV